ncbi:MAG: hypothetical protein JWQ28_1540 [Pedobacter sp.]|jgi:hypothetical protein|nr:hypothetical protein [Pedobacter sp.]
MKKLSYIFAFIFALTAVQVSAQTDKATTAKIVGDQNFSFIATRAVPMQSNALNQVLNSMPNGQNTIINLSGSQYDVRITKDSVVAYLPYFGRSYTPSMDPKEAGTRFKSKDFKYSSVKKKKNWTIIIDPKDTKDRQQLILNVSESGYASLSVNNPNRQPISFNGYISENAVDKK